MSASLGSSRHQREEYQREVDEFTAVAEKWRFFSDGSDLRPYCPECSKREFGGKTTESVPLAHPRASSNGS